MKLLVSHPTGNTFVRALLEQAHEAGWLESFHTTIAYRGGHWTERLIPSKVRSQYERRSYPVPDSLIRRHPFRETVRLVAAKVGLARLTKHETGWASLDEVYRELDRKTSQDLPDSTATHLHCYEDGALESFRMAKKLGMRRSYELPIAHWKKMRNLLEQEAERRPQWAPTLIGTDDSTQKLDRKDEELELAENIVVPSQFVMESIPEPIRRGKTCVLAPFGTPQTTSTSPPSLHEDKPTRIRFLFAGSMGQRKGLGDLLEAFSNIKRKDVELVIVGSPMMEMDFYRQAYPDFTYEPPRPHREVLQLMRSCHVLVLPSIVEGRALVQQEAMSQGMSLLVTANAGGEDLVVPGHTGFLVPASDPSALEEKIHWHADHPAETVQQGRNAMRHSANYTWQNYAQKIIDSLQHLDTSERQQ